jgi:hypothetical protein
LVAGVGNIYASEALFRAAISPRVPAHPAPGAYRPPADWATGQTAMGRDPRHSHRGHRIRQHRSIGLRWDRKTGRAFLLRSRAGQPRFLRRAFAGVRSR